VLLLKVLEIESWSTMMMDWRVEKLLMNHYGLLNNFMRSFLGKTLITLMMEPRYRFSFAVNLIFCKDIIVLFYLSMMM